MHGIELRDVVRTVAYAGCTLALVAIGCTGCDKNTASGGGGSEKSAGTESPEPSEKAGTSESGGASRNGAKPSGSSGELTDAELDKFAEVQAEMKDFQESLGDLSGKGKQAKMQRMVKLQGEMKKSLKEVGLSKGEYRSIAQKLEGNKSARVKLRSKVLKKRSGAAGAGGGDAGDAG